MRGRLAHFLRRRQKKTDEDSDNGDDDQQLDQREGVSLA
jgi:hypothetical protein